MFCLFRRWINVPDYGLVEVPCNKCIPCMLNVSEEWVFRARLEMKRHKCACMLTLTYDGAYLPENAELYRPHLTNFIKRLRKKHKVRYLACGEYGSSLHTTRPHFHLIIFGYDFPDRTFFKRSSSGNKLYNSSELSALWKFGWATVEDVEDGAIRYVTKYLTKLKPDKHEVKPFTAMSLKPSIGYGILTPGDYERGYVYLDGYKRVIPRTFYRSEEANGRIYPDVIINRRKFALSISNDDRRESYKKSLLKSEKILDKMKFL